MYMPKNYAQLNAIEGMYSPSVIKPYNNKAFEYWERSLFQRACSTLEFELPPEWGGEVRDFFYYCLFKLGYIVVFDERESGVIFQPCNLRGQNLFYQPTKALISNPAFKKSFTKTIGKDCELIKLTPDYMGIWDIIAYYAEKLSSLDSAINMSIINNKFAYVLGAKNKAAAEALKKVLSKINKGEPAVIVDSTIFKQDGQSKDTPIDLLERPGLKQSYITSDQLMDFQTILNNFDAEVGIPTIPYHKKERMVTSEAESRMIDSTSRSLIWFRTLEASIDKVNKMFNLNISVEQTYKAEGEEDSYNG